MLSYFAAGGFDTYYALPSAAKSRGGLGLAGELDWHLALAVPISSRRRSIFPRAVARLRGYGY